MSQVNNSQNIGVEPDAGEKSIIISLDWGRMSAWFLLVVILLIAFGLRVYDLDGQSIWNDEGLSIYRASQSISQNLSNTITIDGVDTRDTNPPLYFLSLHLWRLASGDSVFALRLLAVMLSLLSVPLIFQIGAMAFDYLTGLIVAFLLAISPFDVWMSQEMRNYSLLLFFNLLSLFALFRLASESASPKRWRWLFLWGVATLAGIYTHYFSVFILAFGVLALIWIWFRQRSWRPAKGQLVILALVGLICLPFLWIVFNRFRLEQQIDFVYVPIQHILSHAASVYSAGLTPTIVQPLWRVAPAVILAAIGVILGWHYRKTIRQDFLLFILGYLILPILLLFALSAINPIYNGPRHLLISLPPFLLLVAAGLGLPWLPDRGTNTKVSEEKPVTSWLGTWFWRVITLLFGTWLIISQFQGLYRQYTSNNLIKDDFRGLAEYLSQVTRADDLIILHDTISAITFDYYYDGLAPFIGLPSLNQTSVEKATHRLQEMGEQAQRVWFITSPAPRTGFPRHVLDEWANSKWQKLLAKRFPSLWLHVNLEAFIPEPEINTIHAGVLPEAILWGDELTLHGFELSQTAESGSFLQPILYMSKNHANSADYDLSFRLEGPDGQIWAQIDEPLWNQYPPSSWPANTIIQYAPVLTLPAGTPPGEFRLLFRVTRANDHQPLLADDQVEISLSDNLKISTRAFDEEREHLPAMTSVGKMLPEDIELFGVRMAQGDYKPGHPLSLDVYWLVHDKPTTDFLLSLQLTDQSGNILAEKINPPTASTYPPTSWQRGEFLLGKANLIIPAVAEAGTYQVELTLVDPETRQPLKSRWPFTASTITLPQIMVSPWPLETEIPEIDNERRADFGEPAIVELYGFELSNEELIAGDTIELTLVWRSLSKSLPASYAVFVHLVDEEGQIISQVDGVPAAGFRPTTSWRQNEVITDHHLLVIPSDLGSGTFDLWIGMYDPETGQRLPIFVDGQRQANDRLLLNQVEISP